MGRPPKASITTATRERLLDAALGAFAAQGLAGSTLAAIASEAGVTRPSLLHHFPSKEELYEATLARAFGQLGALIEQALLAPPPPASSSFKKSGDIKGAVFEARLTQLVGGFVVFAEQSPEVSRLFLRSVVADPEPFAQQLLVTQAGPLLDRVVDFLAREGRGHIRKGIDLRGGLLAIIIHVLARAAAGAATDALWGKDRGTGNNDVTWALLRHTLLAATA
jgi:AcrR family transcriptional regulator